MFYSCFWQPSTLLPSRASFFLFDPSSRPSSGKKPQVHQNKKNPKTPKTPRNISTRQKPSKKCTIQPDIHFHFPPPVLPLRESSCLVRKIANLQNCRIRKKKVVSLYTLANPFHYISYIGVWCWFAPVSQQQLFTTLMLLAVAEPAGERASFGLRRCLLRQALLGDLGRDIGSTGSSPGT